MTELGWEPSTIDVVLMATLTPDYPIPATAIIVQDRLGIPKSAAAFDLPSGTLGFTHGLQIAGSMLSSGCLRRALVLSGEVSKSDESADDSPQHWAVCGHSGSVCALEFMERTLPMHFDTGGDGSTFDALYMPIGGVRNPPTPEMFSTADGLHEASDYVLDIAKCSSTTIAQVPASVRRLLDRAGHSISDADNVFLTPMDVPVEASIRSALGLQRDRVHGSLSEFGASGSGTQPLAMIARAASRLREGRHTAMLCGVGPGLAWGSAWLPTDGIVCPEILEV